MTVPQVRELVVTIRMTLYFHFQLNEIGPIDLLIGGSPCNELSLCNPARKGLGGRMLSSQEGCANEIVSFPVSQPSELSFVALRRQDKQILYFDLVNFTYVC